MLRLCRLVSGPCAVVVVSLLAGCAGLNSGLGEAPALSVATPASDDVRLAHEQFGVGAYGNAETHFRRAVEREPSNAEAWLGLAASYDQLRRFDLADRAYNSVRRLVGNTPEVLNNIGYSHLLRGDLGGARRYLTKAYSGDPNDRRIISNIETLNEMLLQSGRQPVTI